MTLTELSKELGVPWSTLKLRLKVLKLEKLDLVSEEILRSHFRKGLGEPGSYNNGEIEIKVKEGFLPPEGFVKGSLQKGRLSKSKGLFWVTNGLEDKMVSEIPEGFVKGRSKGETKRQETNLKRYGKSFNLLVDLDAIQSRRKQTCLRKYGGISPTCSSEVRAKVKQAWSEKSEEELEAIKSKSRQTWENKTLEEKEATKSKRRKTWSEKSDEEIKAIQSKRRKKYFFEGLSFDSSWELEFYKLCKLNGLKVKREPVVFDYEYSGTIYHYIPDFEVEGILVEIKNNYLFNGKTLVEPYKSSKTPQGKLNAKYQCLEEKGVILLRQEDFLEFFSTFKVE